MRKEMNEFSDNINAAVNKLRADLGKAADKDGEMSFGRTTIRINRSLGRGEGFSRQTLHTYGTSHNLDTTDIRATLATLAARLSMKHPNPTKVEFDPIHAFHLALTAAINGNSADPEETVIIPDDTDRVLEALKHTESWLRTAIRYVEEEKEALDFDNQRAKLRELNQLRRMLVGFVASPLIDAVTARTKMTRQNSG